VIVGGRSALSHFVTYRTPGYSCVRVTEAELDPQFVYAAKRRILKSSYRTATSSQQLFALQKESPSTFSPKGFFLKKVEPRGLEPLTSSLQTPLESNGLSVFSPTITALYAARVCLAIYHTQLHSITENWRDAKS